MTLQWRHSGRDGVSNHQLHDCLINRLFRRRSKKSSKLRATCLCAGNSPVPGEFPAQMASHAENVSIWWRHHDHDMKTHSGLYVFFVVSQNKLLNKQLSCVIDALTLMWRLSTGYIKKMPPCYPCFNLLILWIYREWFRLIYEIEYRRPLDIIEACKNCRYYTNDIFECISFI